VGVQPSYGKGQHPLLRAGSRVARGKITLGCIQDRLNYCVIFVECTKFTSVVAYFDNNPNKWKFSSGRNYEQI